MPPLGDTPYRRVCPDRFRRVTRSLDPADALLYAHLCCGRPSSPIGLCEVEPDILAADLRAKPAAVRMSLDRLATAGAIVRSGAWVYVCGWILDDRPNNKDHAAGIYREIRRLSAGAAGEAAHADLCEADRWHVVPTLPPRSPHGGVDPTPTMAPQTETETETETVTKTETVTRTAPHGAATATVRTVAQEPPDLDETRAYFREHGSTEAEAEACHDYWLSQGWRRKAGPIRDWQATCRTWIRNAAERGAPPRPFRTPYGAAPQPAPEPRLAPEPPRVRPEPDPAAAVQWAQAMTALRGTVKRARVDSWLVPIVPVAFVGGVLDLDAPDAAFADYVDSHFADDIALALPVDVTGWRWDGRGPDYRVGGGK